MLGYVMVGTNDLQKSASFYEAIFEVLGAKRNMEFDDFIAWSSGDGTTGFCVTKPNDGNAATVGNGTMMALAAPDNDTVDKIYAMAIEMGGTDEGAPGPRADFDPDFYAGYFRDLDGNKLNIFHYPNM